MHTPWGHHRQHRNPWISHEQAIRAIILVMYICFHTTARSCMSQLVDRYWFQSLVCPLITMLLRAPRCIFYLFLWIWHHIATSANRYTYNFCIEARMPLLFFTKSELLSNRCVVSSLLNWSCCSRDETSKSIVSQRSQFASELEPQARSPDDGPP